MNVGFDAGDLAALGCEELTVSVAPTMSTLKLGRAVRGEAAASLFRTWGEVLATHAATSVQALEQLRATKDAAASTAVNAAHVAPVEAQDIRVALHRARQRPGG
jgi:hypothetical protein